jgi:hypothetical protein
MAHAQVHEEVLRLLLAAAPRIELLQVNVCPGAVLLPLPVALLPARCESLPCLPHCEEPATELGQPCRTTHSG